MLIQEITQTENKTKTEKSIITNNEESINSNNEESIKFNNSDKNNIELDTKTNPF